MTTLRPSETSAAMRMPLVGSDRSCMGARPICITPIGQDHAPALGADASRSCLEHSDDAETEAAVRFRHFSLDDALRKMADHCLERLARFDMRAPDVAAAVIDHP